VTIDIKRHMMFQFRFVHHNCQTTTQKQNSFAVKTSVHSCMFLYFHVWLLPPASNTHSLAFQQCSEFQGYRTTAAAGERLHRSASEWGFAFFAYHFIFIFFIQFFLEGDTHIHRTKVCTFSSNPFFTPHLLFELLCGVQRTTHVGHNSRTHRK